MKFGKNTLHLISFHVHLLNTVIIQLAVVHAGVYSQHSTINRKYCSGHNSCEKSGHSVYHTRCLKQALAELMFLAS